MRAISFSAQWLLCPSYSCSLSPTKLGIISGPSPDAGCMRAAAGWSPYACFTAMLTLPNAEANDNYPVLLRPSPEGASLPLTQTSSTHMHRLECLLYVSIHRDICSHNRRLLLLLLQMRAYGSSGREQANKDMLMSVVNLAQAMPCHGVWPASPLPSPPSIPPA